jgi:hypothetical protein
VVAVSAPVLDEHKLREFCHALMFKCRFNATEAYLTLDPTVTRGSASVLASRLLADVKTGEMLAEMAKSAVDRNELSQDDIIGAWIAMSRANVMDYFDCDEKGQLKFRDLSKLDVKIQRNIAHLEVTTEKVSEMITSQTVKLKLVDRRATLHDMAKAAELFGPLGNEQGAGGVAEAIDRGFERVRAKLGAKTFDAAGIDITQAVDV